MSLYQYVMGSPLNLVDPFGMQATTADNRVRYFLRWVSRISALAGRTLTSKFLGRWLDATGEVYRLSDSEVKSIRSDKSFKVSEKSHIHNTIVAAYAKYGEQKFPLFELTTPRWESHNFGQNTDNKDYFTAFHDIWFKSTITGCIKKSGNTYTFNGTHLIFFKDSYAFSDSANDGRRPFAPIVGRFITDYGKYMSPGQIRQLRRIQNLNEGRMRRLQNLGLAKPFDIRGNKREDDVTIVTSSSSTVTTQNTGSGGY